MMFLDFIEYFLSWCLRNVRGHDARLFTKGAAFASLSTPSIEVTSLDCGPSGSDMKLEHTQFGENRFPTLTWPLATTDIKEYILICEDADIPLPGGIAQRIFHEMFYAIPPSTTTVASSDFQATSTNNRDGHVKGGFSFTKTHRGNPYTGPSPALGHGPHRYFYQLVALNGLWIWALLVLHRARRRWLLPSKAKLWGGVSGLGYMNGAGIKRTSCVDLQQRSEMELQLQLQSIPATKTRGVHLCVSQP